MTGAWPAGAHAATQSTAVGPGEEYLLSRECNELMVKMRQDSVHKGVKPLPGARSLADVRTIRPTYDEVEKGIPEVKELFRDTFGI